MASFIQTLDADPAGLIGALAENGGVIDSGVVDTGGIDAGLFCTRDASDGKIRAPASQADVDQSEIVIYDPLNPVTGSKSYDAGQVCPTLRALGAVWAKCEEAMAVDDTIHVRVTAKGGNTDLGAIRNDEDRNAATGAVVDILETDANVDDGDYVFGVQSEDDAVPTEVTVAASSTAHATFAAAVETALEAAGNYTVVDAAEAGDVIQLTITDSNDATKAITVTKLQAPSTGTVLSVTSQGVANATCVPVSQSRARVAKAASAAGACKVRLLNPSALRE